MLGKAIKAIKSLIFPMTYADMYSIAQIRPEKLAEVKWVATKIRANKARYEAVATAIGCPWYVVGVIHFMEGGGKFTTHLHNGDPLTAKTVNVPKGRPAGNPPFSWEFSAIDALTLTGWKDTANASMQVILDKLEAYNGLGYKRKKVPSPYLWSFTQFYTKGKYVADGKYDMNAVSKQPGVVAIMKELGIK